MMNYMPTSIFFGSLIMGPIISISASSWIGMWMGMEINLMSFIPIISLSENNKRFTEATLKYFLVQALASNIFLFSCVNYTSQINNTLTFNFMCIITMISLILKLGAAPLHFWFPSVMSNISWTNCLILMTWQKLTPLYILSLSKNQMMIILSMFSAIVGSLMGLNQMLLRNILSYSSINHMGWMMATMLYSDKMWLTYLMIYSFTSFTLVLVMKNLNIFHINQTISLNLTKVKKAFIFLPILSLGGLPPFIGFLPKWLSIFIILPNTFLATTLIMSSLITLYFYMRIIVASMMISLSKNSWNLKSDNYKMTSLTISLILLTNTLLLPMILIMNST